MHHCAVTQSSEDGQQDVAPLERERLQRAILHARATQSVDVTFRVMREALRLPDQGSFPRWL